MSNTTRIRCPVCETITDGGPGVRDGPVTVYVCADCGEPCVYDGLTFKPLVMR